ncbi:ASST-domain-containing protein [Hyaloraphidium curvatum]|nr:ASST-domain-containing protein [Hyaloraphidium curvatum]
MGIPTVHPTGVTLFNPEKAYPGFVLFQAADHGAVLLDPIGREVQVWKGLQGFPNKLLPNGNVLGSSGTRNPRFGFQDQLDLVEVDAEGRVVWSWDKLEEVEDPGTERRWIARQHHDFQREGSATGYFAPGQEPKTEGPFKTLILVHRDVTDPRISDQPLLDDRIVEIDHAGKITWEWHPHEHFDELGFDDAAKDVLRRKPNPVPVGEGVGDWLHINSLSYVGPNRWFDAGDERFHPDNLIWDSRESNIIAIVSKATGKIAWKLGPRYDNNPAEKKLGWIIGLHHAHIIPRGLPGEGNLLLFDNGGWAGYGDANPSSDGTKSALRDYSRVLEIDPTTLEIKWQYTPREAGYIVPLDASRFYSPFVSSAQRLPNGNTLITEGSDGRIFEVTPEHETVWEYVSPYWGKPPLALALVYRAYKYPYSWFPRAPEPEVHGIARIDNLTFRVPGASSERVREVVFGDAEGQEGGKDFCVVPAAAE